MSKPPSMPIAVVVVLHDSAQVVGACLESLREAAPRRGIEPIVIDNASRDQGAQLAAAIVGEQRVVRLEHNHGFGAGVNAGWARASRPLVAVLNPDTRVPPGALDALADILEANPGAALAGPRVVDGGGRPEGTAGRFPTLARERSHALMLHLVPGVEGRRSVFPRHAGPVDWLSGCAWLLRREAIEAIGPMDESYFMYYEDVDYCRRAADAGWSVLAVPEVTVQHEINRGSTGTVSLPADGGPALVRYFAKFHPEVPPDRIRSALRTGWRIRRLWRNLRGMLGDPASITAAERYRLAIESLVKT